MIVTVTFNPALDKTACIDRLRPHELNRLAQVRQDAGGKGINVSRTVAALGGRSVACGFLAGQTGRRIAAVLRAQGIDTDFIELAGESRTNLKLVEPDGALTEINEPGPAAGAADLAALTQKLTAYAGPDTVFVLAGSAGPGLPDGTCAALTARLKAAGARVLVDTGGAQLAAVVTAPVLPDLIKPNAAELAELLSRAPEGLALPAAARALCSRGIGRVCVSMGGAGACLLTPAEGWRAAALPVRVQSTVGAGDAMTAAFAYGMDSGLSDRESFRLAMAVSAAACALPGTQPPSRREVDAWLPRVELQAMEME